MEFTARLRHLQASPQKVRLVVDLIRGKDVEEASTILATTRKSAARPLAKLLRSAVANAENRDQNVDVAKLPDPQPDSARVKPGHDQWQVLIGICTHLGCIQIDHQGPYNGYFCPCHGSVYDTSGRIRSGPAPANLPLPPYEFVSDTRIRIG